MKRTWKMKDGRKIKIKDMTTRRIKNAMEMMWRQHVLMCCSIDECDITFWEEEPLQEEYEAMERELIRREKKPITKKEKEEYLFRSLCL